MYAKEFEDLLKEYLTDGVISTQERQVLLKKAQKLGYDVDEVDLYIDAQLQKGVKTTRTVAAESGSNKTASDLLDRLAEIDKQQIEHDKEHKGFFDDSEFYGDEIKARTIASWPIPNTKEDLIEFIGICKSNLELKDNFDEEIYAAWKAKAGQIIMKCRTMLKDDSEVMMYVDELDKKVNKKSFISKLFGKLFGN